MQEVFEFCRNALPLRPKRPERLFFCLFPDIETSIDVRRFGEQFVCANDLRGRLLELGRLHISLQHVGDYKYLRTKHIYAARQAGKAVSMHPFDVALHSITSFDRPLSFNGGPQKRPLVLLGKGDALSELHNNLGAAMEKNGLRAAKRFTPHMTLLYGPGRIAVQTIKPIHFSVNEFALIHSELGLTRYNLIDCWSLQG